MPRLTTTHRITGLVLGGAMLASACTSGSTADTSDGSPGAIAAAPTTTTIDVSEEPFRLGLPRAQSGEAVEISLPPTYIISDGGAIRQVTGDRAAVLARVEPLNIGQDPAEGQRYGAIDSGGDRIVVVEVSVGDRPTEVVVVRADGLQTRLGAGSMPSIDANGRMVAFVRGDELVLSNVAGTEIASMTAPGVGAIDLSADATTLAVTATTGVSVITVGQAGFGEQVTVASGSGFGPVAWRGEVLTAAVDGGDSASIVDLGDNGDASGVAATVPGDVVGLDWSSDGSIALVSMADGRLLWATGGVWSELDAPFVTGAQW